MWSSEYIGIYIQIIAGNESENHEVVISFKNLFFIFYHYLIYIFLYSIIE